ncbi:MAG: M60 family peptidase N-terminal accessory domain-containing protein [Candidatus Kapaibacterium sp.]
MNTIPFTLTPLRLYLLMLACSASLVFFQHPACAQLAEYPLDANASDVSGNHYDGQVNGSGTFITDGGRKVLRLPENTGSLLLPKALSARLDDGSNFQISFDFKLELHSGGQGGARDLLQIRTECNQWMPRCPGIGIITWWQEESQQYFVVLSFADGLEDVVPDHPAARSEDNLHWLGRVSAGEWNRLSLTIDLDLGGWTLSLNDTPYSGTIDLNSGYTYNRQVIKEHVVNNPIVLGNANADPKSGTYPALSFDNLRIFSPAEAAPALEDALVQMTRHEKGETTLSNAQQEAYFNVIASNLLGSFESVRENVLNYIKAFEAAHEPLFTNKDRVDITTLPYDVQLAIFLQNFITQNVFVDRRVESLRGVKFEAAEIFPGVPSSSEKLIPSATVELNGTYHKNPAVVLTMDEFVVRPTGYWAPAGEIVTLVFDTAAVARGLSVVVGAHYRNVEPELETQNRMNDIATEFSVNQTVVKVANPYGGGIYLKVPAGTDVGWTNVEIRDAMKSAYYSHREGRKTDVADWIEQVTTTTIPWVDVESDQYMFTYPLDIATGVLTPAKEVTNPDAIMDRWDSIMTTIKELAGRTAPRARAEYYILDRQLVTPAFGAGYPMSLGLDAIPDFPSEEDEVYAGTWNPFRVLKHRPNKTIFHEMGHNLLHPHMFYSDNVGFNAETIVHVHGFKVYNTIYGMSIDSAFASCAYQHLTIDQAAMDWMISWNFRHDSSMSYDPTMPADINDEIRYQHRGFGIYGDLVRLFGWDAVGAINGRFYKDGVPPDGPNKNKPFVYTRERFVKEACAALNLNVTPLYHFWGIQVSDSLRAELAAKYPPSPDIAELLGKYLHMIPRTKEEFMVWYNQEYILVGNVQQPRWDSAKENFDKNKNMSDEMIAEIQKIMDQYNLKIELPAKVVLMFPWNNSVVTADSVELVWSKTDPTVYRYQLEIAENSSMTNPVIDTSLTGADTSKILLALKNGGTYWWRVRAENVGGWGAYSNRWSFKVDTSTSGVETIAGVRGEYRLSQIYPNPFHGETSVGFYVPQSTEVRITVMDMTGKRIETLLDAKVERGDHTVNWRGTDGSGSDAASGLYLVVLESEGVKLTRSVLLVN